MRGTIKSVLFFLVVPVGFLTSSPVVLPGKTTQIEEAATLLNECVLPPVIGINGRSKYIEDCDSLDQFPLFPLPDYAVNKYGVHPKVCCPEKIEKSSICFPTDEWCPSFVAPNYEDYPAGEDYEGDGEYLDAGDYEYGAGGDYVDDGNDNYDYDAGDYADTVGAVVSIAEARCEAPYTGWQCVNFNQCGLIVDTNDINDTTVSCPGGVCKAGVCGYDEAGNVMKICCPPSFTIAKESSDSSLVPPRYPGYECLDKSKLCKKWKRNGGCKLDVPEFNINKDDPQDPQGFVSSVEMFDFMMGVCMETCGWCENKGCRDEDLRCEQWARDGQCINNPHFMVHTCRESCGVCGFLSPFNPVVQRENGKVYSDITHNDFDCGRNELLSVLNGDNPVQEEDNEISDIFEEDDDEDSIDLRATDNDLFFSITLAANSINQLCGATRISDRWVVTAAHCHDNFGQLADDQQTKVARGTFRDKTKYKETIEFKRVIQHPNYVYPNLYNDIAVIELGRRLPENFAKYGDTPTCLDDGTEDIVGRTATIQGYGTTETGSVGDLLEANLTIINNNECWNIIQHNITKDERQLRGQIKVGLPKGLNNQLICGQGQLNQKTGVTGGSCKGDSGGPLVTENSKKLRTLTGIVSGGLGCGTGSPGWYTKVSFFYPWIKCVIEKSGELDIDYEKVKELCKDKATEGDVGKVFDPVFDSL